MMKYKKYVKEIEQLHNEIIEICKKHKIGTLCEFKQTIIGHYQIVVKIAPYTEDLEQVQPTGT